MKLKDPQPSSQTESQKKSVMDTLTLNEEDNITPVKLPEKKKAEDEEDALSKKIGFMRQMVKMNEEDQKKELKQKQVTQTHLI